jgi:radical SAM superfamily enzyme YgiQ (UPF0313 family)
MTLGVLRIAGVLERAGVEVEVLDLSGISNFAEAMKDHTTVSKAKVFGITATTPQLPSACDLADSIHLARPDARVILGGPHITLVNAAFKKEKLQWKLGRATSAMRVLEEKFDVLVAGDGEEAIFSACLSNAPKLVDADDPKSSLFLTNAHLNKLPFPARHLVDAESYHYQIDGQRAYSLIAQLGCPFECGFCGGRASPMLRKIRTRTSESIVAEMLHMHKTLGCDGFMFYDDELNVNKKVVELMNMISQAQRDLGVEWRLRGFVKSELFTEAQAEAMYRAGFRWLLVGFESGSPRILHNINKKATLQDNTRCVEIAKKYGLKVKALMSIGHPGESLETVWETRDWLLEVKPEAFDLTIITCYPGTPYYDEAEPTSDPAIWRYTYQKTGDVLYQVDVDFTEVADYYKGDPDGGYVAYVFTEGLTREALVASRGLVEKEVREKLGIPYDVGAPALRYEHSMGQSGPLPPNILRISASHPPLTK